VVIVGDGEEVIGSAIAEPVEMFADKSGTGNADDFTRFIYGCTFAAGFPDLPRDQDLYEVQVQADKVEGSDGSGKALLTASEAEKYKWRFFVTIPGPCAHCVPANPAR